MGCIENTAMRHAERCYEAEGALRDVGLRVVTNVEAERCREAAGGLRDVTRLEVG